MLEELHDAPPRVEISRHERAERPPDLPRLTPQVGRFPTQPEAHGDAREGRIDRNDGVVPRKQQHAVGAGYAELR